MTYKHTQIGYLMIVIDIILALYFVFLFVQKELNIIAIIIMSIIILILASFATLTVSVDHDYVKIKFGYGIFRKKFSAKEITSVKAVKNHWYYGWGIKYVFWKPMWVFNVSGFDAIEIKMVNKKTYRIGTDEPEKLEKAVNKVIR